MLFILWNIRMTAFLQDHFAGSVELNSRTAFTLSYLGFMAGKFISRISICSAFTNISVNITIRYLSSSVYRLHYDRLHYDNFNSDSEQECLRMLLLYSETNQVSGQR